MNYTIKQESGVRAVNEAVKTVNRRFEGCKGVQRPERDCFFLAVDEDFGREKEICLSLANLLTKVDVDYRLGLKYDGDQGRWNIVVELPPFSDDFGGVLL